MAPKKEKTNDATNEGNQRSRRSTTNQSNHQGSGITDTPASTVNPSQSQPTTSNTSDTTSQGQQSAPGKVRPKHATITASGTKFDWADNTHINRYPLTKASTEALKKIELAKLQVTFKDTNGKQHTFPYHNQVDLTSNDSIKKFNAWRNQLFRRKLRPENEIPEHRPRWSKREKNFLISNLQDRLKKRKGKFTDEDWQALTDIQNEKFKGKKRAAGEVMVPSPYTRRGKKDVGKDGKVTKTEGTFGERNPESIKAIVFKWPDTKSIFDAGNASEDDCESQEDSKKESDEEKNNDSDIDHHLEDSSDDEKDGMRPAANPTGGSLISA